MHGLTQIIYANEQACRRAKANRLKRRLAEAQETIDRITRSAKGLARSSK